MRNSEAIAAVILLAVALPLLRPVDAAGAPAPSPSGYNFAYYGVAQSLQLASRRDYVAHVGSQEAYTNTVALGFVHSRGNVVAPASPLLHAVANYDLAVINLGKNIWKETKAERQRLFGQLQSRSGFQNIDALVVIDEPYLEGYDPTQLDAMIQEVDLEFGGTLKLIVNFNPKGFFPSRTGYTIPGGLDLVSFNVYPTTLGLDPGWPDATTFHETLWKSPIAGMADFLRTKTTVPLLLVAQGFSDGEFFLQPYHVDWSVEVAAQKNLEGVVFWYSEPLAISHKRGFSHPNSQQAAQRIRELGKRILHR